MEKFGVNIEWIVYRRGCVTVESESMDAAVAMVNDCVDTYIDAYPLNEWDESSEAFCEAGEKK